MMSDCILKIVQLNNFEGKFGIDEFYIMQSNLSEEFIV